MPTPAATRKRSRAQLRAAEPEEEQDELKSVIGGKKLSTPLSAAKRRKLNGSSPAPASKTVIGSLGKRVGTAIGDLMGWGSKKGKDNVAQEEVDELAHDEEGSGRKEKDIWEVDTSEPEETLKRSARVKKLNGSGRMSAASTPKTKEKATTPAKVGTKSKRKIVTAGELAEDKSGDIWEVEVSDPENGTPVSLPVRKGMTSVQRAKTFLSPATKDAMADIPKKRSAGRPKKSDILKKASVAAKQAIRESLIAGGSAVADEEAEEGGVADTPSRRKSGLGRKEDIQADVDPQPELVSSAKKRGRPKKNLDGVIDSAKKDPKGILTPSKKDKTLRSRKSVAFEENDAEMDLGFKDIPSSANSKLKTVAKLKKKPAEKGVETGEPYDASAEAQEEPASEDERSNGEEIACSICNGLDSKKGNQIILCDSCDFALHLKCYGLSKVPKGDWYCKDCEPEVEEEVSFPLLNEGLNDNETSGDLPDIENFEDHLRNVQRIVLDKVTGQKRIKLCGHDEEMQKVHQVVEQTVLAGEGNSMLVIGARGCGKTTVCSTRKMPYSMLIVVQLVESVISDLSRDHRDSFHVVRLNGFIHTDDKLALKEIWRQLGREMEVEDDVAGRVRIRKSSTTRFSMLTECRQAITPIL
jgi:origin recognition complex subunit 4